MIAVKKIEDAHHVARHCSKPDFWDEEEMTELKPAAFEPVANNPDISVGWIECYDADFNTCIDAVCKDMSAGREVKPIHKLALLRVGRAKEIGFDCRFELDVEHDPLPNNDSHALIKGIPLDATILHQELADAASENLVPVVPYKRQT